MEVNELGVKEDILAMFEARKGVYFSGEEIAADLSVSRAAVWKAVNALRREGYEIDAVPNKGYCLSSGTDILSAQGIQTHLSPICQGIDLHVLQEAESTNALLREAANAGAPEGYVILSRTQTKGRGRLGRSFYSPADTGIYLSLLLRPAGISPAQAVRITTMAAVAVCEAVEKASGKQALVKWVNDVYVDGRKVSGILTEASISMENGCMDYVILGVGINAYAPPEGFPAELASIAGAVFDHRQSDGKNILTAEFLNRFLYYYTNWDTVDYVAQYRARSLVIGKEITVLAPSGTQAAAALDVDEECRLIVRYEDGRIERLSSGEISIRLAPQEPKSPEEERI